MSTTKNPEGWRGKELPENKPVDKSDKDADASRALQNPISTKNEPRVRQTPATPPRRDPQRTPDKKQP